MAASSDDTPQRILLCLVADDQVIDRYPSAVRYLQVGLIDEPVDTLLVLPDDSRALSLGYGPTSVITHRKARWPLANWARRSLITAVQRRVDDLHHAGPVIVNSLSVSAAPLAADLAAAADAELVLTLSSIPDLESAGLPQWIANAAAIITPSEAIRQAAAGLSSARSRVETVHFGVAASESPAAFREVAYTPSLIFAGALTEDSGCETLFHAAKRILQVQPDLRIFIIGKGPAESSLRRLAEALDLGSNVVFTGRLQHWHSALEGADLFCLPQAHTAYREEPIHALAAGLAVVAAQGSVYDFLMDEQTALLFPAKDDARLAEQICRLLEDRTFARALAATGQSRIRTDYSVGGMVADHVRLYAQIQARASPIALPSHR